MDSLSLKYVSMKQRDIKCNDKIDIHIQSSNQAGKIEIIFRKIRKLLDMYNYIHFAFSS